MSVYDVDEFAVLRGTDKSSKTHGYTRAYERHFSPLRDRPLHLLEIGVGDGGSLRMWREYFPKSRVYGLDIRDCRHLTTFGITVFKGSQGDEEALDEIVAEAGPFDIVIDEGSHLWGDQVFSFQMVYPHLRPGGYYVIEDLHTSYWNDFRSGDQNTMDFLHRLVHDINLGGKSGYGELRNDPDYLGLRSGLTYFSGSLKASLSTRASPSSGRKRPSTVDVLFRRARLTTRSLPMPQASQQYGGAPMKLNLGCGEDFRPGWLNMDSRPLFPEGTEFLCCDLLDLDRRVTDGCAEEIVARNVLEYVPWRELNAVMVSLGRKLRANGRLFVRVPDLASVARAYAAGNVGLDVVQRSICGAQGYPEDACRSLWDAAELIRRLAMIGVEIERVEQQGDQIQAWGRRIP